MVKEFYTASRDASKSKSCKQAGPALRTVTRYVKSLEDLEGVDPEYKEIFKGIIMKRHPAYQSGEKESRGIGSNSFLIKYTKQQIDEPTAEKGLTNAPEKLAALSWIENINKDMIGSVNFEQVDKDAIKNQATGKIYG